MKCPHKLEPHQIQGMDCIHIFPVIQWLIKRSLETRKSNADTIRSFASWQFTKSFSNAIPLHSDSILLTNCDISEQAVNPIKSQLERKFVHPSRETLQEQDLRTKTTMLEYGILGLGSNQRQLTADSIKAGNITGSSGPESEARPNKLDISNQTAKARSESDTVAVENLLSVMSEAEMSVDASLIGSILSEQSSEIRRLAQEYEKTSSEEMSLEQQFRQKEAKLKASIAAKRLQLSKLQDKENIELKLESIKEKIKLVDEKLEELNEQSDDVQSVDEKLQNSEVLNMLRKQKNQFKQHCREEQKKLENEIENLTKTKNAAETQQDSPGRSKNIMNELEKLENKHDDLKKQLADMNKEHVGLSRKFAEIPTRTELSQYQKRFIELYNQRKFHSIESLHLFFENFLIFLVSICHSFNKT